MSTIRATIIRNRTHTVLPSQRGRVNPRFRQTLHNDETSTSSSSMTVTPGTGSDPVCEVINEITSYMGPLRITIEEKLSPLLFWKRNERVYPKLSFLAKNFLTPNASSVPVEGLFSVMGLIKNSRRTSIAPYKLNKLTFVHDNIMGSIFLLQSRMIK